MLCLSGFELYSRGVPLNIRHKYRKQFMFTAGLRQYKWNTIKIRLPRLIINASYGTNFATIHDFFISQLKKLAVFERLFWHCRCREV